MLISWNKVILVIISSSPVVVKGADVTADPENEQKPKLAKSLTISFRSNLIHIIEVLYRAINTKNTCLHLNFQRITQHFDLSGRYYIGTTKYTYLFMY